MRFVLKLFRLGGHTVSELEAQHHALVTAQDALRELANKAVSHRIAAIESLGAEVSALKNLRSLI